MLRLNWKKILIICLDIVLAVYIVAAFTAFDAPDEHGKICRKVSIQIQDESTNGFISVQDIKRRLVRLQLYPIEKPLATINVRKIEETLKQSPFVKSVECYKTEGGEVCINVTQRMPIIRIKANNGDDYYIDDNYRVMPNSHYTSNLVIATGYIDRRFATSFLAPMSMTINESDLWRNQIVQIHVKQDRSIELVPRVGQHIIYIGKLPVNISLKNKGKDIQSFLSKKLTRLEKFYKYGLSQAGWNKYEYINLEFDNQIICKKTQQHAQHKEQTAVEEEMINEVVPPSTEEKPQQNNPSSIQKIKTQ